MSASTVALRFARAEHRELADRIARAECATLRPLRETRATPDEQHEHRVAVVTFGHEPGALGDVRILVTFATLRSSLVEHSENRRVCDERARDAGESGGPVPVAGNRFRNHGMHVRLLSG